MVIDSSALIAILSGEAGHDAYIERIASADARLVGAPYMERPAW
jgi:uncharacterized protein with PIN domain